MFSKLFNIFINTTIVDYWYYFIIITIIGITKFPIKKQILIHNASNLNKKVHLANFIICMFVYTTFTFNRKINKIAIIWNSNKSGRNILNYLFKNKISQNDIFVVT